MKDALELNFSKYKIIIERILDIRKIYIEITNRCNLNCKMCFRRFWNDPIGEMGLKEFKHILSQLRPFKELKTVYLGGIGEPTIHPNFIEMARMLKENGYRVEFTTNGTTLKEYSKELVSIGVDTIIVSIDSPDPFIYKDIRGTEFYSIIENVQSVQEEKKRQNKILPAIGVEAIVMKKNLENLEDILKLAGMDLRASFIMFSNLMPFSEELAEEIIYSGDVTTPEVVDSLNKSIGKYHIKVITPKFELLTERRCQFIEESATVIRWDGEVTPCYRFLHSYPEYVFKREKHVRAHSFGNIFKERLSDIWTSVEYERFRYRVKNFSFPSCTDCPLRDVCEYAKSTEADCWGDEPSCGDCLWSREIIKCP